jgi:membrane associated rhomboid family serine protease
MAPRSGVRNYRLSFNFYITSGVQALLLANFAVFIFQLILYHYWGSETYSTFLKWFGLVPAGVVPLGRVWQLFTYLFLHDVASFWHILFNMLFLWMFGKELELVWGRNRFLQYYFLTGMGAGLINVIVKTIPAMFGAGFSYVPTIGASGAIFGILIANAILFPDRQVIFFPIPLRIRMRTAVMVMGAIEFVGTLGSGGDNVSHICHLGGMLIGWLYLRRSSFLYRLRNEFSDWRLQRNRKKFEVFMKDHKDEPPSRPDRWVN